MSAPDLLAMQLRHEIEGWLENIKDHGTPIEGGGGMGSDDIHVVIGGVKFHIQIHWPLRGLFSQLSREQQRGVLHFPEGNISGEGPTE